jgi:hypothetical protein
VEACGGWLHICFQAGMHHLSSLLFLLGYCIISRTGGRSLWKFRKEKSSLVDTRCQVSAQHTQQCGCECESLKGQRVCLSHRWNTAYHTGSTSQPCPGQTCQPHRALTCIPCGTLPNQIVCWWCTHPGAGAMSTKSKSGPNLSRIVDDW